jgi:hypothetical protein
MAKAQNKTQQEKTLSVEDFISKVADEGKRKDCQTILQLMEKVTGEKPAMWGAGIVGFGNTLLKYDSGREVDWFLMGFSPRKANLSLYPGGGFDAHADTLAKLGKHKLGGGCLYISKLEDVDLKVLEKLLKDCLAKGRKHATK